MLIYIPLIQESELQTKDKVPKKTKLLAMKYLNNSDPIYVTPIIGKKLTIKI